MAKFAQFLDPAELPVVQMHEVACIAVTTEALKENFGIEWQEYDSEGLGVGVEAVFLTSQQTRVGLSHLPGAQRNDLISIWVQPEDAAKNIDDALTALELSSEDLLWLAPGIELSSHSLFREDTNGARFHIGDFSCRADAEAKVRWLMWGAHKQAYFIEPAATRTVWLEFDPKVLQAPRVVRKKDAARRLTTG